MSDPFWSDSIKILFDKERLSEFYPSEDMTETEKLNAIVRFFIYASIIAMLYTNNVKYAFLAIIIMIITYIINKNKDAKVETFELQQTPTVVPTVVPTKDNPFMNPNIFDDPVKFKAPKYYENNEESNKIKKEIYKNFSYNLYKDVSDIYDTNNGFRQFYTVPDNLNGHEEYKDFLYGDMKFSAKENTYDSYKNLYETTQNNKHNF
jgi:Family of unknown function (DUF5762)